MCTLFFISLACLVGILCALRWCILVFLWNSLKIHLFIPSYPEYNKSAKLLFAFCFYGKAYTSLYRTVLRVEKYLEFWHTLLVLHNLICFNYGSSFCLEQTLGPRIGYLPLLIPVIKAHFSSALPPGVDTVWFEYKGLPLKW